VLAGIYYYKTHSVATIDIMGVIVRKDVRDKIIIYAGTYVCVIFLLKHKQQTSIINFIEYLSCCDTVFGMKKSSATENSATLVSENC